MHCAKILQVSVTDFEKTHFCYYHRKHISLREVGKRASTRAERKKYYAVKAKREESIKDMGED